MSTSEDNKAAVRGCFENASQGNFEALDAIVSPDYVLHPEDIRGVEGLKEMVEAYRSAIADLRITIDQQFTEGDHVATRYTIRGTHDRRPDGRAADAEGTSSSPASRSAAAATGGSRRSGSWWTPSVCCGRSARFPRWPGADPPPEEAEPARPGAWPPPARSARSASSGGWRLPRPRRP